MRQVADQGSAFGQELWAQRELQELRRQWPDWAFLVVHHWWIAVRGKKAMISESGPGKLRTALLLMSAPSAVPTCGEATNRVPVMARATGSGMDGAAVVGLRATVMAARSVPGALPARRTRTGTWAVVADPVERASWWPLRRPWSGRRSARSQPERHADPADSPTGRDGLERREPSRRRRRRRSKALPGT